MRTKVERARSSSTLAPVTSPNERSERPSARRASARSRTKLSSSSRRSASANACARPWPFVRRGRDRRLAPAAIARERRRPPPGRSVRRTRRVRSRRRAGPAQSAIRRDGRTSSAAPSRRSGGQPAAPRAATIRHRPPVRSSRAKIARPEDDVLHLEVGVAGALEPGSRLEAELLALGGMAPVIGDDPEPGGRLGFDPVAAAIGCELEAAAELRLRSREVVVHEQRGGPQVSLRDECVVVDLLRDRDRRPESLDSLLVPTFESPLNVASTNATLTWRRASSTEAASRFDSVRRRSASVGRPCRWSMSPRRSSASESSSARPQHRRRLGHFQQLVRRLL